MKVKTLADVKRLPIGTKLKVIRNLLGEVPEQKQAVRVITAQRSNHFVCSLSLGGDAPPVNSYSDFPKASEFEPTENGFRFYSLGATNPETGKWDDTKRVIGVEYIFVEE